MQPMQPIRKDERGTIRFQENAVVRYLLDNGRIDLNQLAVVDFPREDREQFAQLIGYSVCGFHELSYVSDETALKASSEAQRQLGLKSDEIIGCRDSGCPIHTQNKD